jgi:hypothetical protein
VVLVLTMSSCCCCWVWVLNCCLEARSTGVVTVPRGACTTSKRVTLLWCMKRYVCGRVLPGWIGLGSKTGANPHMCTWGCCQPHLCLVGWPIRQPGITRCTTQQRCDKNL